MTTITFFLDILIIEIRIENNIKNIKKKIRIRKEKTKLYANDLMQMRWKTLENQ